MLRAKEVERVLDPRNVMLSYNSRGGTGDKAVEKMLEEYTSELAAKKKVLERDQARVDNSFNAIRSIAKEAKGIKSQDELRKLIGKYRPKN